MMWRKASHYHLVSGCGRYTVSRAHGKDGWKYPAWRKAHKLKPPGTMPTLLAVADSAQEAKQRCAADSGEGDEQ